MLGTSWSQDCWEKYGTTLMAESEEELKSLLIKLHSQGGVRRGVRALGSYQEGTGKSGSFGMWNHPRGHVWNVTRSPNWTSKLHKNFLFTFNLKVKVKSLSRVRLFATPWTVAHQAPPSMGFPRQEYWSGVPSPSPFNLNTCTKYTWPRLKSKTRKQNLRRSSY